MSFGAPSPPDPNVTAQTQQNYNTQAATTQQNLNSYNQNSAYGSINYVPDSSSPSGYRLETSYSPTQQGLYNTATGTQAVAGQTAQNLLKNSAGMYSQPFNGNNSAVTNQLNQWSGQYLQPIFDQQSSNLEAQLRNQGLTPGSEAYNNAKNLLARNQGDVTNQYLQQNEGQAFNQALQSYEAPLQTISGLYGIAAPQGPTQQQTPTVNIQPANYQGAVQSNYQGQLQNYENTWNNIGKLGTAAVGLAAAPFTGGLSLGAAGALGGMFGGSPYISGSYNYGGTQVPQVGGGWG